MTSTSNAATDRTVDLTAQSGDSPRDDGQLLGSNFDNEKENVNPRGGIPEHKSVAEQGGRDTTEQQDEVDDFGLPIRARPRPPLQPESEASDDHEIFHDVEDTSLKSQEGQKAAEKSEQPDEPEKEREATTCKPEASDDLAQGTPESQATQLPAQAPVSDNKEFSEKNPVASPENEKPVTPSAPTQGLQDENATPNAESAVVPKPEGQREKRPNLKASEWSHQRLTAGQESDDDESEEESDNEWKEMPALGEFDEYDDFGRLLARGAKRQEEEESAQQGYSGAGKGYTRVQLDEDAQSATSLDEDTSYLFKEAAGNSAGVEGEELRDPDSQLQATKDILTEGQRIAYVGVTRLSIHEMSLDQEKIPTTKSAKKALQKGRDATKMWGQATMARLYAHMEIDAAEQIMIEQLAQHGVQPLDLVPPLMQNARVKNPMAEEDGPPRESTSSASSSGDKDSHQGSISTELNRDSTLTSPPPPYETAQGEDDPPEVQSPSDMPTSAKIDIDLRWTVLCDLFLVLIADSAYDARSRSLLERVGRAMEVPWLQITKFEKRVMDALEMQEAENNQETWDESDHMEKRRKSALKRRYMVMGLATVGGGLVIGLSAGLLAPVIGAGLAAGFTTVGITGTSAFLGGAGGTALIASGATLTGGTIGLRASHRRTGAVRTFEYRPLHNNKRVNLIITVSGWMTGKVDDVRLPYSTVDPIMGDMYSVLWEPEMLQSMGQTINILATEALTQGLQHVLGSTVLVALMASLQLPLVLTKLSYLIDNPWNVSLARANAAGLIMADSLIDRNLGKRPVTLLGYSLGSRVIFSCLKELADRGAQGLVENVYMFGSPNVANKDEYIKARSVVSGRFVNGYASNDWILGYLFRATSGGIMRVAGLAPIEGIPGLENRDVTQLVNGHMDYRTAMPRLLKEVGWEVLSEEFAEIEDPDPESHGERQRELIREIDEARKEAEMKPEKKRFGLFKRGKLAQKKGWETYDVERNKSISRSSTDSAGTGSVLFDIDAIKAELASEAIEVKQLESTLPPMKLDLNSPNGQPPTTPSSSDAKQKEKETPNAGTTQPMPAPSSDHKSLTPDLLSGPHEEEGIEMTFDTSYNEDIPQRSHSAFEPPSHDPCPTRPELRSSATMPVGVGAGVGASALGALAMEPNAWAEHDFGGGEEGDMELSFE